MQCTLQGESSCRLEEGAARVICATLAAAQDSGSAYNLNSHHSQLKVWGQPPILDEAFVMMRTARAAYQNLPA